MKYFIADAFTDEVFKGNPAGVCLTDKELTDETMQKIAFENNLSETAFLSEKNGKYFLRWFTPETEIDLCGHAILATAFILMNFVDKNLSMVFFETKSGPLSVERTGDKYKMNLPSRPPKAVDVNRQKLEDALGCKIIDTFLSRDLLVLAENEETIKNLSPDFEKLKNISNDIGFAVIVTAKGDSCDFVSRFFAPNAGINEDPVTGSAHSTLIPFWSERLGKNKMSAIQLSPRSGKLFCEFDGDRVNISGNAVCYLSGEINI